MQISTREFKTHLSAVLRRVRAGEEISVTSHGKVVARLSPPLAEEHSGSERLRGQPWVRAGKAGAVRGAVRPTTVPDGTVDEIVRWVRGD
ncbi:MAG TPA: type II toxin-antitoxin system prevent-host-death family antitoxin [Rhodanobacteraceae bacterium]|nr:type II toxin-antitoxin system prevent-host-death family antitoxin [Rhodanobacteraceae bacterium]